MWEVGGLDDFGDPRTMSARIGLVASSETATASIAAMRESIAYREGIVATTAAGEIENVFVAKSKDASGSSKSVTGSTDVRRLAACWAASIAVEETGPVTMIVGGWRGEASLDGAETVMCTIPEDWDRTGDSGIPAVPTRAGGLCFDR